MELTKKWQKIGEAVIGNAGYGNYLLRLYGRYIDDDQSVKDNSHPVQLEIRHYSPDGSIKYYSSSQKITGDIEKSSTNSTNKVCYAGETVLLTETKTIQHEEDGSKSISVGASFTNSYFGNTVKIEPITVDLPKIDRLNQIVVNEGVAFNVDTNENVSNEIPVTITKYVDSYTSKLRITMENNLEEQTVVRDYTDFDGDTLTFTEEELSTIYNNTPNYRIVALTFDLDSYDGETNVGTYTLRQTATLSETDLYPTFTDFEYADVNDITTKLTDNPQILIKGYSDVQMTVSDANKAIAHKGATIKQYTFANGTPIQDIIAINYPIKTEKFKPQNKELGVTAIDSRDLPTNILKTLGTLHLESQIIEWDGTDPFDREKVDIFYKVSDKIFSQGQLIGGTVEMSMDGNVIGMTLISFCTDLDDFGNFYANSEDGSAAILVINTTTEQFNVSPGLYFPWILYADDTESFILHTNKLTTIEQTINAWVEYKAIEKKPFSAERKNAGTSTQVTLKLSGNIWDGNFGKEDNSIKEAIYKYKKTTDTEWTKGTTTLNVVKNGSSYSLEQDIAGDLGATGFDQEESYDIYVEVSDQLSTISDTFTLGAGSPGIARYKNCVALGAPYDEQVGGRVQIPKVTGETDFVTNLKKQGKEVATLQDLQRNIITVGYYSSSSQHQSLTTSETPFNLNNVLSSVGSKLTLDTTNKAIKIGANVKKILLSTCLTFNYMGSSGSTLAVMFTAKIKKNDETIQTIYAVKPTTLGGNYFTASMPPKLIEVEEDDLITLQVFTSNTPSNAICNSDIAKYNFVTAEVVE